MRLAPKTVMFVCCMLFVAGQIFATPLYPVSNTRPRPARWPDDSKLCVYIQPDPNPAPPNVAQLLKEGMERWQSVLFLRGISLDVVIGAPPAIPDPKYTAAIPCTFRAAGTTLDIMQGCEKPLVLGPAGTDDNQGIAACGPDENNNIDIGEIAIRDDLNGKDEAFLRNLGQHELCHALGLSEDPGGVVTNHRQTAVPNTFNAVDLKEINMLYPITWEAYSKAVIETLNLLGRRFKIGLTYNGAVDGHVSVIALGIALHLIDSVDCPAGWICFNPNDPQRTELDYPFYTEYMEGGAVVPPPWESDQRPPLGFRSLDDASALSISNPSMEITIYVAEADEGSILAWAGGESSQVIPGPVQLYSGVPSHSPRTLFALAVLLALGSVGFIIRRKRRAAICR